MTNWLTRNFWWLYAGAILFCIAFAAGRAYAAPVAVATPGPWNAYSGSTIVIRDLPSLQACMDALTARGLGTYTCRTSVKVVVTDTPPPQTCTAPAPPATQPGTCPAGTTGSWTQTRTVTAAPYPTCWTTTAWQPTAPPAGACVAIPPPTTLSLVYSATAGGNYAALDGASVTGAINVRLSGTCSGTGAAPAGPWTFYVDGVAANTENLCPYELNGDNALITLQNGTHKIEIRGSQPVPLANFTVGTTPPPQGTGSATVGWTPPTQNSDGSSLTDLAGYRVLYGTTPADLTQTVQVAVPSATSYVVTGLVAGTWYFTARSYNTAGAESTNANVVSKVVP